MSTGYPLSSATETEILDLVNQDLTCNNLADFPMEIDYASASLMNSSPVICGGSFYDGSWHSNDKCYILTNGTWSLFATMMEKRAHASIVHLNATSFQIFGGEDWDAGSHKKTGLRLKSTEIISSIGLTTPGPNMPTQLSRFAMAKLNNTVFILIGGYTDDNPYSNSTWYYYHTTQTFKPGPTLLEGRAHHTAGIVRDHTTNQETLMVVGGWGIDDYLASTEMLKNDQWQKGTIN